MDRMIEVVPEAQVPPKTPALPPRRLPIGAEVQPGGGVHFRVWAPNSSSVEVVTGGPRDWEGQEFQPRSGGIPGTPLDSEGKGYFSGFLRELKDGSLYKFRLESGDYPDPASRFQPGGPHGPSQVVDPRNFGWRDANWKGLRRKGQVIYEMHIGTFTPEGTYEAAAKQFAELAGLGVTVLEVMPVAEFPGRFGWGYDGVNLFAPTRLYGKPDDLRRFVDSAHAYGLGVILDVVYNHFGPDGNYLAQFSPEFTTDRYTNEWGEAINFDGPDAGPVREFFVSNAVYWIDEFHFDGFRFDATHSIYDESPEHILTAITREARKAAKGRSLFISAENECQHAELVRSPEENGYGLDAIWGEDFHHTSMVALTGHSEAYYQDYKGTAQELVSAIKWGYLYHGQWYSWQKKHRGTPSFGLEPSQVVFFLQNHDQVANALRGERLQKIASPGAYRAMTALLLLGPGTPLLFQGQEFASPAPFLYFAEHSADLAKLVNEGRREFLEQFPSIAGAGSFLEAIVPESEATFKACKLDFAERTRNAESYLLHRDLLRLRKTDPVFSAQQPRGVDGAVLADGAFVLRYFGGQHGDRLLIVNLGNDLTLCPAPEPLLAPTLGKTWSLKWSSEDPAYHGNGTPAVACGKNWVIPGRSAQVFEPGLAEKSDKADKAQ